MDKDNKNLSYYRVFKHQEVILTGINHYDTVACLTTICLICLILFQDCAFNKLQSDSALRVSFQGNMIVYDNYKCNRWYFKFSGNECSGPMTIEAVVYNFWPAANPNLYIIIGHLRGTVKISHKALLQWNYEQDSVVATPWVMQTLGGIQCPG